MHNQRAMKWILLMSCCLMAHASNANEQSELGAATEEQFEAQELKYGQQAVPVPDSLLSSKAIGPDYLLHIPENYGTGDQDWPLVVFLHGSGERGTNIAAVRGHSLARMAENKKFPFIMLTPQCRAGTWWQADEVMKLLEHVQSMLKVDENRIYVTGLSMGGFATWNLITKYPDKFAAAIPICGGADASKAEKIAHMPIWAFHGDQDKAVPVERVQAMVNRLKELNPDTFKFTLYENCGHNSWTRTYQKEEVFDWLLSHSK